MSSNVLRRAKRLSAGKRRFPTRRIRLAGFFQSNCLDSGNNQLFASYGRKRRSVPTDNDVEENVEETLSAIIRVLAEGEEESAVNASVHRSKSQ